MNAFFRIIFQNPDFAVVSKLTEKSFHSESGPGFFSLLQNEFGAEKIYPVHRLDKITTGLIITAKNPETAAELGKMFENHEIGKYYIAVSDIPPVKSSGVIRGDMKKVRRGMWKLMKTAENPAVTEFTGHEIKNGLFVFLIKLHTGRTHQIRAGLKSIGSPVLGDPMYYPKPKIRQTADRAYLHSYCLKFTFRDQNYIFTDYPQSGKIFTDEETGSQIKKLLEGFPADYFLMPESY
ncbi:MAG: RNA pseudouridine synthase [Spirochaetes bacterium]|nr:RNA pseudouridine synthase [Spirochaetota bacterium]